MSVTPTVQTAQQLYDRIGQELYTTPNADVIADIVASIPSIGGGGGGGGGILSVDVQVTDAQLRDLVANPVELVPAPGTGLFIDVLSVVSVLDAVGGGYTGTPPHLLIDAFYFAALVVDFTQSQMRVIGSANSLSVSGSQGTSGENKPLRLSPDGETGDLTGGDPANTLSLRVYYRIEPAVPFGN